MLQSSCPERTRGIEKMPNMISISRKGDENGGVPFVIIDEEICAHFGAKVSEDHYYKGWYDAVGYSAKENFADIIQSYEKRQAEETNAPEGLRKHRDDMIKIMKFLDENFVLKAWYSAY
jgi:hypothetical protein